MAYVRRLWIPDVTKLSADEFNRMEEGIDTGLRAVGIGMPPAQLVRNTNVPVGGTFNGNFNPSGTVFLLLGQTNPAENGVWTWIATGTPMTRTPPYDQSSAWVTGMRIPISTDPVYGGKSFAYTGPTGPTLGLDPITFATTELPAAVHRQISGSSFFTGASAPLATDGVDVVFREGGRYLVFGGGSALATTTGTKSLRFMLSGLLALNVLQNFPVAERRAMATSTNVVNISAGTKKLSVWTGQQPGLTGDLNDQANIGFVRVAAD